LDGPVSTRRLDAGWVQGSTTAGSVLRRTLAATGDTTLQAEYTRVVQRGIAAEALLKTALAATTVPAIPATAIALGSGGITTLDKESLAKQLRMVARMVGAGQAMGMPPAGVHGVDGRVRHPQQPDARPAYVLPNVGNFAPGGLGFV
jgi:hypothetical protein